MIRSCYSLFSCFFLLFVTDAFLHYYATKSRDFFLLHSIKTMGKSQNGMFGSSRFVELIMDPDSGLFYHTVVSFAKKMMVKTAQEAGLDWKTKAKELESATANCVSAELQTETLSS